jgi:hypothetical protein
MSEKKHKDLLGKIWAHPISHNIEWSELVPALESIGVTCVDKNGYHLTRAGRTVVLGSGRSKALNADEVVKLRHFLDQDPPVEIEPGDAIVAIDHHHATVFMNPGTQSQSQMTLHANLIEARHLHQHPSAPPFHDISPLTDRAYLDAIAAAIAKSHRIVVLSHGTGTSNAANQLLDFLEEEHSTTASRIVAVQDCDLEALTDPQLVQLGVNLLQGYNK